MQRHQGSAPALPAPYTIRRAVPDDAGTVLALLNASAAWIHERDQGDGWPKAGFGLDRVTPGITSGAIRLVEHSGRWPQATLAVDQCPDPEFGAAGLDPVEDKALILHRLAVVRPHPHQPPGWDVPTPPPGTLGRMLIEWTIRQARRQGFPWVWLNVAREAIPLQAYYARCGFEHIATVALPGRRSGSLWRRPTTAH